MRENHSLPDWLTGRTEEDERAQQLLQQQALPSSAQETPPGSSDDLAWLDEFLPAAPTADEGNAPPLLSPRNQPPRITRISSHNALATRTPLIPSTVSAPPPPTANQHLARYSFRNRPAWWQTLDERERSSHSKHPRGVLPAWMRE